MRTLLLGVIAVVVMLGAGLACNASVMAPRLSSPAEAPAAATGSSATQRVARPPTAAVTTPAVSNDADDDVSLATRRLLPRDDHHEPPPAVALELKHMSESYQELPSLRRLPDFLSLNALLALMPDSGSEISCVNRFMPNSTVAKEAPYSAHTSMTRSACSRCG